MKTKRLIAFIIDFMIAAALAIFVDVILSYLNVKVITPMIGNLAFAIIICKDCFNGMSIGKHIINIQVIDSDTKQIASPSKCVIRNLFYFTSFIDLLVLCFQPKNLRLGDCAVHTEVSLRNRKLQKVELYKIMLAIAYVLIGLTIIEITIYLRASSLGLFGYLYQ